MSCAEALRRCPTAVFVRPRHDLYREYSAPCGRLSRKSCLASSAPASTRGTSTCARRSTRSRRRGQSRGGADVGARCDVPSPAHSALDRQGGVQGRFRPPQNRAASPVVPPAPSGASWPRFRCARCRGSVRGRGAARAAVSPCGASWGLGDTELKALLPGSVGGSCATVLVASTPATSSRAQSGSRSPSRRRSRATSPIAACSTPSSSGWPAKSRSSCSAGSPRAHRHRQAPLHGLLDPQPLDHVPAPVDEAGRIGELACRLLERGPRRPPPLAAARRRRRLRAVRLPTAHARG